MPTPKLSDAEWKVMDAVWAVSADDDQSTTARDVRERLVGATGWAYTTVKTMLDRLAEKGVLAADRRGKATRYRPLLSRAAARQAATRGLLSRAFAGGAGRMVHFLVRSEKLSAKDRVTLRRMLDEIEADEDADKENANEENADPSAAR